MAGIIITSVISGKYVSEKFKFFYVIPFFVTIFMIIKYGFDADIWESIFLR